jgi:hypothetical protein
MILLFFFIKNLCPIFPRIYEKFMIFKCRNQKIQAIEGTKLLLNTQVFFWEISMKIVANIGNINLYMGIVFEELSAHIVVTKF